LDLQTLANNAKKQVGQAMPHSDKSKVISCRRWNQLEAIFLGVPVTPLGLHRDYCLMSSLCFNPGS